MSRLGVWRVADPDQFGLAVRAATNDGVLPVALAERQRLGHRDAGNEAAFLGWPGVVIGHIFAGIGFVAEFEQRAFQLCLTQHIFLGIDHP